MMWKTLLLTAASAVLLGTAAGSAAPVATNWSGLYLGFHAGYAWGNNDYKFIPGGSGFGGTNLFSDNTLGSAFSQSSDGGVFGGHFGVNSETSSNWVWGGEVSFDGSSISKTSTDVFAPIVTPTVTYKTDVNWLGTVTPRLGYDDDGWLIYAKGGLAFGEVESQLQSTRVVGPCTAIANCTFMQNTDHLGWTIGAGVDYRWDDNWAIGLEYNYYDLSSEHLGGETTPNTTWPVDYSVHPTFSSVLARITYMVGEP